MRATFGPRRDDARLGSHPEVRPHRSKRIELPVRSATRDLPTPRHVSRETSRPTARCHPAITRRLDGSRGSRLPDKSIEDEQT